MKNSPGIERPTVFINGRFLAQRVTGVQRFGREVLCAMDALLRDGHVARWPFDVSLIIPDGVTAPALDCISVVSTPGAASHRWEQFALAVRTGSRLLVNFGFTGPLIKRDQIITVHDGAVVRMPHGYSMLFRLWYRFVVAAIGRRAAATIAVSEFSAGEAVDCFGISRSKLHVSGEGWEHISAVQSDPGVLEKFQLNKNGYLLVVSSPAKHKNFAVVAATLRAMGKSAPRCIAVGAADANVFRGVEAGESSVEHIGYVSDAELKALYENTAGFIMPSFYEGFGIPPLEAMSCGAPVISSTAEALREVCGDAAIYFDPCSPAELAQAINSLMSRPEIAGKLRREAQKRLDHYSWRKAATCYLDLIATQLRANEHSRLS